MTGRSANFQRVWVVFVLATALIMAWAGHARAGQFQSPDVFVLGDSQATFGAGPPLLKFFQTLETSCAPYWTPKELSTATDTLKPDDERRVGVLGVRSTSIHSWVATRGRAKGHICNKDPTWGVNAASFGAFGSRDYGDVLREYQQVGETPHTRFCAAGRAPFAEMFKNGYYDPKLFVMFFLGNSASRWAGAPRNAATDVAALEKLLPPGMPCVIATTAPTYRKKTNIRRLKAQRRLRAALFAGGRRCKMVDGLTRTTLSTLQGAPKFFRRRKNGSVKDPFHPNDRGAEAYMAAVTPALCRAVADALNAHERPMSMMARLRCDRQGCV